jgi:hypothetical protein
MARGSVKAFQEVLDPSDKTILIFGAGALREELLSN